jgi:tRNA 2-thiouridine synthesizing protein C
MSSSQKSLLIICQQAPYGSDDALAAMDVAMSFAAFEQSVSILFKNDGVWQLLPEQQSASHQSKRLPHIMQSFELYGLEAVYADNAALEKREMLAQECSIPVQAIDSVEMTALLHAHDSIMVF